MGELEEGSGMPPSSHPKGDGMQVQPYLWLDGRCEEALDFYRSALGAVVTTLMRFKDLPGSAEPPDVPPGSLDTVMHAVFRIGDLTLLASDGDSSGRPVFQGFSIALTVPEVSRAERLFAALAEGGQVRAPLAKTFFSPAFAMVTDRFGVPWMIVTTL
jgi:PhnB protein